MNKLVKIIVDDDGDRLDRDEQFWHLSILTTDAKKVFCSGEVFGIGENSGTFNTKEVKRGGITCPMCMMGIKEIKRVKL